MGLILRTTSGFANSTIAIRDLAGRRTSNLTSRLTSTNGNSNAITATNDSCAATISKGTPRFIQGPNPIHVSAATHSPGKTLSLDTDKGACVSAQLMGSQESLSNVADRESIDRRWTNASTRPAGPGSEQTNERPTTNHLPRVAHSRAGILLRRRTLR